jgi:hypothetical protein
MLSGSVTVTLKLNRLPLIAFIGIRDGRPSVVPIRTASAAPALRPWSQLTVNVTFAPCVAADGVAKAVLPAEAAAVAA